MLTRCLTRRDAYRNYISSFLHFLTLDYNVFSVSLYEEHTFFINKEKLLADKAFTCAAPLSLFTVIDKNMNG